MSTGMELFAADRFNLLRVILFLIATVGLACWVMIPQHDLHAYGCDPFGYLRQAELFRQHGWIGGLDTSINETDTQDFVAAAKAVFGPPVDWANIIAPHCHHFDNATDAVINQYPPMTGFFLSLFSPEIAPPALYITMMLIVASAFIAAASFSNRASWFGSAVAVGSLYFMFRAETYHGMTSSVSLPESVGFCAFTAFLTLLMSKVGGVARAMVSSALGLILGVMIGIRIPNIFIGLGVGCYVLTLPMTWRKKLWVTVAGSIGLMVGLLPLLAANAINAGGVFATTYGNADASPPTFDLSVWWKNLGFYFWESPSAILLIVACLVVLGRLFFSGLRRDRYCGNRAAFAAGVQLLVAVAFFVTHKISTGYYTIPSSAFALCLVSFDLLMVGPVIGKRGEKWSRVAVLTGSVILLGLTWDRLGWIVPRNFMVHAPTAMLDVNARVWSDMNSGSIYYYLKKYAAKATFGDDCMRMALMRRLGEEGHPQFLVDDADSMHKDIMELRKHVALQDAGILDFYDRQSPVYLLPADAVWDVGAPRTCGF